MIRRVFSSLASFKTLDFQPGLNILLSDKTAGASDQQTRNRAGKSSLVELVHFVCGSNVDPDSTFRAPELAEHSFGLELELHEAAVRVSRTAAEAAKIVIEDGDTTRWAKQPKAEKESQRRVLRNADWRTVLGKAFFDLDEKTDEASDVNQPTFRSLFSYFARREHSGGMRDPMKSNAMQQTGNAQVAICYLIGIDWSIAQQWENLREHEKQIRELKRIVGQGVLKEVLDTAASLRSRLVVAEGKLAKNTASLTTFRLLEQYTELEREATNITRELGELADENEIDKTYVDELERAMQVEVPPAPTALTSLYAEAGIVLPGAVLRRYEDVLAFHESVVRNRRSYLAGEHAAATERIRQRDRRRAELDQRRSEVMSILKSHGALENFVALQSEHGRLAGEVETLRQRFEAATQLESTSSTLDTERLRLVERLRQEFDERAEVLRDAITSFSAIVDELYGEPGQLEFHATPNGPEIRSSIQGDRSRGIGNMEIFCFDMMLMRMTARQNMGPGFLVHDSHLFDGVDSRQIGRALAAGARIASEVGFQYLVTLNSDVLSEVPSSFDLDQYVLPVRLTDATETGGLFGIRFEPPRRPAPEPKPKREKPSTPRRKQRQA